MEEYPEGKFIYVDEDNIPELYLEGYCAAAGTRMLTVYDNKVYDYYGDGHGAITYLKKKNRMHFSGGCQDGYFDFVAKLKKGKLVSIAGGGYGRSKDDSTVYGSWAESALHYRWDGKSKLFTL